MKGVKTGDVFLFDCTVNVDVLADDLVANVESLCREEFGSIFTLIDFVLSPDSLERLVFDVLGVASRLSDIETVP